MLGQWKSEIGQTVRIKTYPLIGLRVLYKPVRGRARLLRVGKLHAEKISLYLGWLGPLQTILHLSLQSEPVTKELVMRPEVEPGPESRWDRDDFGYPWLFPLLKFRRVTQ